MKEPQRSLHWSVRIVQAAVAAGSGEDIEVFLDREKARFVLKPPAHWNASSIKQALTNSEGPQEDCLAYFVEALSKVLQQSDYSIRMNFGCGSVLESEKGEFHIREGQRTDWGRLKLSVFHAGRENANIHRELSSRCFVCPCALRLDGRKLDDLFTGLRSLLPGESQDPELPLAAGFTDADLPTWRLPNQTFSSVIGILEQEDNQAQNPALEPQIAEAKLAYFLSTRAKKGQQTAARVFWIEDGAIVDDEPLPTPTFSISVSLFCSAQDMDESNKADRIQVCLQAMKALLQDFTIPDEESGGLSSFKKPTLLAGGVLLIPFLFFAPGLAKPLILAGSLVGSGVVLSDFLQKDKATEQALADKLEELRSGWP